MSSARLVGSNLEVVGEEDGVKAARVFTWTYRAPGPLSGMGSYAAYGYASFGKPGSVRARKHHISSCVLGP